MIRIRKQLESEYGLKKDQVNRSFGSSTNHSEFSPGGHHEQMYLIVFVLNGRLTCNSTCLLLLLVVGIIFTFNLRHKCLPDDVLYQVVVFNVFNWRE